VASQGAPAGACVDSDLKSPLSRRARKRYPGHGQVEKKAGRIRVISRLWMHTSRMRTRVSQPSAPVVSPPAATAACHQPPLSLPARAVEQCTVASFFSRSHPTSPSPPLPFQAKPTCTHALALYLSGLSSDLISYLFLSSSQIPARDVIPTNPEEVLGRSRCGDAVVKVSERGGGWGANHRKKDRDRAT
jgi:hypothetical protein